MRRSASPVQPAARHINVDGDDGIFGGIRIIHRLNGGNDRNIVLTGTAAVQNNQSHVLSHLLIRYSYREDRFQTAPRRRTSGLGDEIAGFGQGIDAQDVVRIKTFFQQPFVDGLRALMPTSTAILQALAIWRPNSWFSSCSLVPSSTMPGGDADSAPREHRQHVHGGLCACGICVERIVDDGDAARAANELQAMLHRLKLAHTRAQLLFP